MLSAAFLGTTQLYGVKQLPPFILSPTDSLSNYLSRGNRTGLVGVSTNVELASGKTIGMLVDGNDADANSIGWTNATGNGTESIVFDFGTLRPQISGVLLRFSTAATHGGWNWECSADGITWEELSLNINMGNGLKVVNVKTGGARFYRLRHMSGARTAGPLLRDIEFRISYPTASLRPGLAWDTSDRRPTVTMAYSGTTSSGAVANLIDGTQANGFLWAGASGTILKITLPTAKVIDSWRWQQSNPVTQEGHGVWIVEGSNDDAAWTMIHPGIRFGMTADDTLVTPNGTAYRYYRWRNVAGVTLTNQFLRELSWRIGDAA